MAMRAKLTGSRELVRALEKAGNRAVHEAGRALYIEGEKIMAASKQEAPVGVDGVLRASGYVEPPKRDGGVTSVELGYGGAAKGYAVYVHEGVGPAVGKPPFMPPSKALEPWVKKKLGVPAEEVKTVAFLVARSIGSKGLKPTKFLERPFMAATKGMAGRIAARIRRRLERS